MEEDIRFSLQEHVPLELVGEILSISLQPKTKVVGQGDVVQITGELQLSGEYRKTLDEGVVATFSHAFPVNITLTHQLGDVTLEVETFDYEVTEGGLQITAEVIVGGVEQEVEEQEEENTSPQTQIEEIEERESLFSHLEPTTKKYCLYIVQTQDTLESIAHKYALTPDEIMKKNKLVNWDIQIGQVLQIPVHD